MFKRLLRNNYELEIWHFCLQKKWRQTRLSIQFVKVSGAQKSQKSKNESLPCPLLVLRTLWCYFFRYFKSSRRICFHTFFTFPDPLFMESSFILSESSHSCLVQSKTRFKRNHQSPMQTRTRNILHLISLRQKHSAHKALLLCTLSLFF